MARSSAKPIWTPDDLAAAYKQLTAVERGWRDMKGAPALRPVFCYREDRIRAQAVPARGPASAASTHTPASVPSPPRRPCRQTPAGSASPRSCSASRHLRPGSTTAPRFPAITATWPPSSCTCRSAGSGMPPRIAAAAADMPAPLPELNTFCSVNRAKKPHVTPMCGSHNSGGLGLPQAAIQPALTKQRALCERPGRCQYQIPAA